MKSVTKRPDQVGYRETHDGKYYMFPIYQGSKQLYSIGKITGQGNEHIEDVKGYKEAVKRLREIISEEAD